MANVLKTYRELKAKHPDALLLKMLAGYRHDILTSDREVAAFAVTYNLYLSRLVHS